MAEGKKNRPSLQLLVDRKLVTKFDALCRLNETNMSAVVTAWIEGAIKTQKLPPTAKKKG